MFGVEENVQPVISQKLLEGGCTLHMETSSSERPHIVEVVLQDSTVLHVATSQDEQAEWLKNKINNASNFLVTSIFKQFISKYFFGFLFKLKKSTTFHC